MSSGLAPPVCFATLDTPANINENDSHCKTWLASPSPFATRRSKQMFVCICNGVREGDIEAHVARGASSLKDLRDQLGVARDCGKCASCAREVLERAKRARDCLTPVLQAV
jgi:bacterioferritin-associated ferredoxin